MSAGAAAAAAAREHFIDKVLILLHLQHQQEGSLQQSGSCKE
jgi:hypothetical protein